ncbi:hypothetical protein ACJRO7_015321 [Eucalyptus globulus]|uniref:Uncharacterized protein n=1 Tax=Eucalyptus globulus TaxID=34317 RepID=A0ABD3L3N4_EUCGL
MEAGLARVGSILRGVSIDRVCIDLVNEHGAAGSSIREDGARSATFKKRRQSSASIHEGESVGARETELRDKAERQSSASGMADQMVRQRARTGEAWFG